MKLHPFPLFGALALMLSLVVPVASAADPAWWTTRGVKNASAASNLSPATIGQAKHMAAMALAELQTRLSPADFTALQADVNAIVNLAVPQTQAEFDNQRMVLLNGQLKALAKPFYDRLRSLDAAWLGNQMVVANLRVVEPGSSPTTYSPYPWSETASDDSNKSPATIGQLKAVFSLGLEDFVIGSTGEGDSDGDGLDASGEAALGTSAIDGDTDGDGIPDGLDMQPLIPNTVPVATATTLMIWSPLE